MSRIDKGPEGIYGGIIPRVRADAAATNPPRLHVSDLYYRPSWFYKWEHYRPKWLLECAGEFFGVFLFVYAGVSATAVFNIGVLTGKPLGSIFHIAFAYGIGIAFAVIMGAQSSGGHFNPALTIGYTVFKGFPLRKVPYYIASQTLGAFVAALAVYAQFRPIILEIEEGLVKAGKTALIFSAQGTAGIIGTYPAAGIPLKWTFVNEFVSDFFIGMIIWGALDPSNQFVSAASIPFVAGFSFFVAIQAGGVGGIAVTPACDLGRRFAAMAIWGKDAWGTDSRYPAVAILGSIPATLLAAFLYEAFLTDTSRLVTHGQRVVLSSHEALREYKDARRERVLNGEDIAGSGVNTLRQRSLSDSNSEELEKSV